MLQNGFRAALVQCLVGKDRLKNLENASNLIHKAKSNGAQLVALPECFNSPYGTKFFDEYAESIPDGPTSKMLSEAAKKHSIYIIGGTFPERDDNKLYNTCTVWNPNGDLIAKFRKMHLFDIDIPGGITFKESDILCSGRDLVTFEMFGVTVGLGICYDLRFEELAKLYRIKGCKLLVYPGAFNMTTGPLHWELLQRSRALDNQLYVFAISPARGEHGYIAWGHSQVTDPWGKVVAQAKHGEEIIYSDLDFTECDKVRAQIPIFDQRRTDIYDTVCKI
ncbi:omega-amidase NIT2 [Tribolium castaneum]|uniref:omega-amidase n=1 Tax=Tribolium castaneum TaxID=7070 RepID=D6WTV5_TRICA|nr:PREDICTED: omega-amidase NIT2 isoform X2 [Tribolium castaneum]EFA07337.1 Nitrilase and fragile histidine triad fusion protein NitFhit-like Protein [Tribolium castaneum]|eukprot:XP_008200130.1 PREDICTED: omega-amidase NIT2 isoform X2 [Tribolium castaneum]